MKNEPKYMIEHSFDFHYALGVPLYNACFSEARKTGIADREMNVIRDGVKNRVDRIFPGADRISLREKEDV